MDQQNRTLLDGSATTEGKGKGAKWEDMVAELYLGIRKRCSSYVCFQGQELSDDDYLVIFEDDKREKMSLSERWRHDERMREVMDKIDWEKTVAITNAKIEQARLEAAKNKHASHELGAREFTLTYSPKWFDDTEARDLMKKAIQKLIKYYNDEIIQLRAVGEVGSNGLSHVHCFYKLRGGLKISDKNFKRAYKYWNPKKVTSRTGHEGGHHANVRIESDFQGYIDKDVDSAWLDVYFPSPDPTA